MTKSLLAWFFGLSLFVAASLVHPIYGLLAYMQTFFFAPHCWWWGKPVAEHRWGLIMGFVALGSGLLFSLRNAQAPIVHSNARVQLANALMLALWLNATFVHNFLAPATEISAPAYWELTRFVVLFFIFQLCVKTWRDMETLLFFILIGLAYMGYEVTINDRGRIINNRLEGVGVPGGSEANHLASLIVMFLPLVAVFFIRGRWWQRLFAAVAGPLILNVLLVCNSRGAFLGAVVMLVTLVIVCPKGFRKKMIVTAACGFVALYLLLGDPRIVQRFFTTFRGGETRDASAQGRLRYWQAGLQMIADHPFGRGGYAFKKVYGPIYIARNFDEQYDSRAVHQGFINDACEWGVQGLVLRLGLLIVALRSLWLHSKRSVTNIVYRIDPRIFAACLFSGALGFLIACCFTNALDNEWGYWIIALGVVFARLSVAEDESERQVRQLGYQASISYNYAHAG